jgi:hypothetical protein
VGTWTLAQAHPGLLDKGDLGILVYFILAMGGIGMSMLAGVWLLLRSHDRNHAEELSRILSSHSEERKLVHEGTRAALRELRQEIRATGERIDRLSESMFSLAKKIEES